MHPIQAQVFPLNSYTTSTILLGTDGVDEGIDLLDVLGLSALLADVADFLPGVVLVLALLDVSKCTLP